MRMEALMQSRHGQSPRPQWSHNGFLGFAHFYRCFIQGFSPVAARLTALIKGGPRKLGWNKVAVLASCWLQVPLAECPKSFYSIASTSLSCVCKVGRTPRLCPIPGPLCRKASSRSGSHHPSLSGSRPLCCGNPRFAGPKRRIPLPLYVLLRALTVCSCGGQTLVIDQGTYFTGYRTSRYYSYCTYTLCGVLVAHLGSDVISYIKSSIISAYTMSPCDASARKLHALPVPQRPWSHLSIDIVTDLPSSNAYTTVMAVVNRFSNKCSFFTLTCLPTVFKVAEVLFHRSSIYIYIVSDHGPQFTLSEWKAFIEKSGVTVSLMSGYQPQANRTNLRGFYKAAATTSRVSGPSSFPGWSAQRIASVTPLLAWLPSTVGMSCDFDINFWDFDGNIIVRENNMVSGFYDYRVIYYVTL